MKKRALMLTAATAALMSGQALGASPCNTATTTFCDITTAFSNPLYTGTVPPAVASVTTGAFGANQNITIDTNGSVTIGINPPTAPAVTINSNNSVTNVSTIAYQNITYAVGTLLQSASVPTAALAGSTPENFVGEFYNSTGTLNLTGSGTNKTGILIAGGAFPGSGDSTSAATAIYGNQNLGVFTGITGLVPSFSTGTVAIGLGSGSIVEVQGTSSFGINLIGPTYSTVSSVVTPTGGATLIGDIDVGGSLLMTPTTVGSTTATNNVAINIAGFISSPSLVNNPALAGTAFANTPYAMIGNLNIFSGGTVSSEGAGAEGVVVLGAINGGIVNSGTISTFGTTTPSTATNASDPEAGSALIVANSITGGIANNGRTLASSGSGNATAVISTVGTSPTIFISPAGNLNNFSTPITIGKVTSDADYGSGGGQFSLLNRGSITAAAEDANNSAADIVIAGTSGSPITFAGGIFNSGTMSSSASTNSAGSTVNATTLDIGNNVTIGMGQGSTGASYSLINSNETTIGTISAAVGGTQVGTATAILIEAPKSGATPGTLTSIFNSGTISATASTTTLTSTGTLAAYGILDQGGTLVRIDNSGTISALTSTLDNNSQIAVAIDTAASTAPVTINNISTASTRANIVGDVYFGSGAGTFNVTGSTANSPAAVTGNIVFNNATLTNDSLTIGNFATVTGQIAEAATGRVNVMINPNGTLNLLTSQPTNLNSTVSTQTTRGVPLQVGQLNVVSGGVLKETLSQGFNQTAFPGVSVINAQTAAIGDSISAQTLQLAFGSFVASPGNAASSFVLINSPNTPAGQIAITSAELNSLETSIQTNQSNAIPFLFTGSICANNISTASVAQQCTGASATTASSQLVLNLTPKPATGPGGLGLTGFAAKMFPYANQALVNDNTLGAAMIAAIVDQPTAQAAYASFAPDVSGATRATAISLTDSATNVVAARQRELRMYANQEGDTTLWGQQFAQRLSQANTDVLTGYNDSGFGFVLGADAGDRVDGRYGGAFTFFTGGMSQKEPISAKTSSEYYMLTGYTDWRGKGLFIDTQLSAGYANLKGRRYITLTDPSTQASISRTADGNRPSELLAGSVTAGGVFTAGSTVIMPQVDLDGLTSREEAYTESGGGDGFDLRVQPYYADSLRAFFGTDIREDVNFGDFYLQPEIRAGYRYDFIDGAVKLKANFASVGTANGQVLNPFTITGPDPGRGNFVLGGGIATTTGDWSIGLSYDFVRASSGPTQQSGILTLVGRI